MSASVTTLLSFGSSLLRSGLPLGGAWTIYLANVLIARWLSDRDRALLPRVLRAGALTGLLCVGLPAVADARAACLEHREALGVCFVGRVEREGAWRGPIDLQMDEAAWSVRVIPDSVCEELRGADLSPLGWVRTPAEGLFLGIDYPLRESTSAAGNWYRVRREGDDRRTELLDLGRCRLLQDEHGG